MCLRERERERERGRSHEVVRSSVMEKTGEDGNKGEERKRWSWKERERRG